jgi:hypothetical protein
VVAQTRAAFGAQHGPPAEAHRRSAELSSRPVFELVRILSLYPESDVDRLTLALRARPKYECELTAEGWRRRAFDVWELFKKSDTSDEEFPKTRVAFKGETVSLKVYENTFVLERER